MRKIHFNSIIAMGICAFMIAGCGNVSTPPVASPQEEEAPENARDDETIKSTGVYSTDFFEITIPDDLKDIVDLKEKENE